DVTRNSGGIASAGMGPGQQSCAAQGVEVKRLSGEPLHWNRRLHVLHLTHEKRSPIDVGRAQHDIAGSLEGALSRHHPLAMMFLERLGKRREVGSVCR